MAMGPAARLAALVLAAVFSGATAGADKSVSAVQKVIQLLTDMEAKAKQEKQAEAVEFSAFQQFCTDTIANKDNEIKEENQLIESLSADIAKLESEITELGDKIAELNDFQAKCDSDLKTAAKQRAKEKADYAEQVQDFGESVDALDRAIQVLSKQNYDRKQASEALVQLSTSSSIPDGVQRTLTAFLEMNTGDDYITRDAPEASAYEFQSGGILELLKKLRGEFTDKKSEAEKAGMNSEHAYNMMAQDLHDSIEGAKSDIADRTEVLQEKKQLKAENTKQLNIAVKDRDEDVKYLADLKVECEEKTKSFKEKQELRVDEIEAINKAREILSSGDVLGNAKEHLPAALLQKPAAALAQLRSSKASAEPGVRRALESFLRSESRRLKSTSLATLAQQVSASSDPFGKVKKMIETMIKKLLSEAGEESEHKGWCDTEVGQNKITRDKLTSSIEGLTAKIDQSEASLTEMGQRLAQLAKEISELTASMAESTKLRQEESEKNAATIADAQAAQTAVSQAVAVLKDFYEKASQATALVQVKVGKEPVKMGSPEWNALANPDVDVDKGHREGMQTFGKTYTGQQDEAGGVLAMLEVISSDFAQLEAETGAAEAAAANEHKEFMAESSKSKAVKEKETSMLTSDKTSLESELLTDKKDLANTQDQLLAADRYYEKLKPQCVDLGMSYEDRAKARQEEIQSLKEALRILSGEDLA